jgi:GDPmannose 4,6-dehydratase
MRAMLQQSVPGDFVVATGVTHTVRDFLKAAFDVVDLDWQRHVEISQEFFRPSEAVSLCGDASLARRELGWKTTRAFPEIVEEMVKADLQLLKRDA